MSRALKITRTEHTAAGLRSAAGKCRDGAQVRRLLALAMVLDGRSRAEAALQNGMDRQTLRDWVHRYNDGGIEGLKSRHSRGAPPALTDQMSELRTLVLGGPDPATHGVERWRCLGLREEVARRFPRIDPRQIESGINAGENHQRVSLSEGWYQSPP